MGYDLNRFEGVVDEELICSICSFVLEDPLQSPECEHAFCSSCINQWLQHQCICPIDRIQIQPKDLKPVPRILKNLLSKLKLKCDYADYDTHENIICKKINKNDQILQEINGCNVIVRLENLSLHLQECEFNPKKPIVCSLGCNIIIPKDELKNHNCIKELRKIVDDQHSKILNLSTDLSRQKTELDFCMKELRSLKNFVSKYVTKSNQIASSLVSTSPTSTSLLGLNLTDDDDDDIVRWSATLPIAKVIRWGGIISTPDTVLQTVIKRALIEHGCPSSILNQLMENAHEKNWPLGLSTLENRQINRSQYANFVCKRVPNKQAVLILACDNRHMPGHMIVEPGNLLIFAHGVE